MIRDWINRPKSEAEQFWLKAIGHYVREISVLLLVFGFLDGLEGLFKEYTQIANLMIPPIAVAFFIAGGMIEWLGTKKP